MDVIDTPVRWARKRGPAYVHALKLLTVGDIDTVRAGLRAMAKLEDLQRDINAMNDVGAKLDRIVADAAS